MSTLPKTFWPALAIALMVSGCGKPDIRSEAELRPDLQFDTISDHAVIEAGSGGMAALDLFLLRQEARYGDRLVVNLGADAIAGLQRRYATLGVTVLPAQADPALPGAPFQASFTRLIVTPPACGDWSEGKAADSDNKADPNWGCANLSNLARMVADPNDLVAGRGKAETPYNAQADTLAVRAYRTHAIKWTDKIESASTVEK